MTLSASSTLPEVALTVGAHLRRRGSRAPDGTALALSPTDSCRDRLAAYYFWKDRQSLQLAVEITRFKKVDFEAIRRWSRSEGHEEEFEEFRRDAEAAPPTRPSDR